jgi:hypothetical protein
MATATRATASIASSARARVRARRTTTTTRARDDDADAGLKAAWYGAEALGKVVGKDAGDDDDDDDDADGVVVVDRASAMRAFVRITPGVLCDGQRRDACVRERLRVQRPVRVVQGSRTV